MASGSEHTSRLNPLHHNGWFQSSVTGNPTASDSGSPPWDALPAVFPFYHLCMLPQSSYWAIDPLASLGQRYYTVHTHTLGFWFTPWGQHRKGRNIDVLEEFLRQNHLKKKKNTFANWLNCSWNMFPNVSWKMKIWLLLRERLCSGSCALLGGSGTFTPPRNLFVEKIVNEALSLRPFICYLDFQFPIIVHQPSLDICFKRITVTCLRHNLLQA